MYSNILCAVDISQEGEQILSRAASLAASFNCELSVVHIIEYTFLPKDYQKQLMEDVQPRIAELGEKYGISKKHRHIKFGQSYSEICELQERLCVDLIVIGSHGKHGFNMLLGSTANGVLQKAKCDVLLVKVDGLRS